MGITLAAFVLFLPGLAWWLWLGDKEEDPGQALAKALGYNIAITAVGAMLLGALKLSVNSAFLAVCLLISAFLCVAAVLHRHEPPLFIKGWIWAFLGFGLLLAWRFWQARSLVLPNWTDSLHHTLIVRKFMEAGTLPRNLAPYLPNPFSYHYAFHSFAALFGTIAGIEPGQAVLTLGNILMAAASLSVYSFTKTLSRSSITAVLAAGLSAFALRMPGYYLTWGRYTLLVGMFLLPLVMDEAFAVLRGKRSFLQAASLGLLFAGTVLGHYFMVVLLALFFPVLIMNWLLSKLPQRSWNWKQLLCFFLPLSLAALGLLPWFLRVKRLAEGVVNTEPLRILSVDASAQWPYLGQLLGPGLGIVLALLAIPGALMLFKTEWRAFGIWTLLLDFLCLPTGLHLMTFRPDYFAMILYFPVAVCLTYYFYWVCSWLNKPYPLHLNAQTLVKLGLTMLIAAGAFQNANPINLQTVLVNKADLDALRWVREHVPREARFFVNTVPWGWEYYRGVDGGAWLLPYTGNWSLAPTIFYGQTQDHEMVALWKDWSMRAAKVTRCETDFWELVEEANLDYVYARNGIGGLQPQVLDQCQGLVRLYMSDGVGIWFIKNK